MEQIDDCCHRFERLRQQRHQHMCTIQPTNDPHIPTVAFQSLDTVRALHQTVVSLRNALEDAHREIDTLKKQIIVKDDIEEGKKYREHDLAESHENLANFPLNIDLSTITDPDDHRTHERKHHHTKSTHGQSNRSTSTGLNYNERKASDVPSTHRSTRSLNLNEPPQLTASSRKATNTTKHSRSTEHFEQHHISATQDTQHNQSSRHPIKADIKVKTPDIQIADATITLPNRRLPQMASKIDVKIKLTSNFQIDSNDTSSETTGDSHSETITPRESSDDTGDKVNVHVESSEAAEVDENKAQSVRIVKTSVEMDAKSTQPQIESEQQAASASGIDNDDSGGGAVGGVDDDSVFVDAAIPSTSKTPGVIIQSSSPHRSSIDNDDEVDDIELILSSDDKEYPQEDMVSISYYEPWQLCGQSGTPILVNFNNISSDNEGGDDENREQLSPSPIDPDQFYNAIKENVAQQQLSLESSDSLSLGDNLKRSYDFHSKSFSLERGSKTSDENGMMRDESFDTFEQEQAGFQSTMGRRWTNYNVFQETDISKCGAIEENVPDKGRRNTCPNPAAYRPIIHREAMGRFLNNNNNNNNSGGSSIVRCPLAVKFARGARTHLTTMNSNRGQPMDPSGSGAKRSSAAQTEITLSTLPEHWRSESHLMAGLGNGFFTLPSKFVPSTGSNACKHPLKVSEKTREARRVLLSDINFTSMVPELSRSADHLCHGEEQQSTENNNDDSNDYSKGPFLKTPDYANRGITPSMSLTSPGVSQWTVNESSFGTQTIQTDNNWSVQHGDSFDSCKSYSIGSKLSFGKHNRSRSCPSVRCALCKHRHHGGIKMSESMNYTPRVTFQEVKTNSVRGSLPDLRPECACGCPRSRIAARATAFRHGDSCGSTESILDEAEDFLRESIDGVLLHDSDRAHSSGFLAKGTSRLCSDNEINKKEFSPSKQTLPFLPKSSKCLKPGHLAKVIAKNGRVVIGRVRYVGPLASSGETAGIDSENEIYVGLQLPNKIGDCNGSFEGRKFFDCEPQHGIFVPFSKIVMAWTS